MFVIKFISCSAIIEDVVWVSIVKLVYCFVVTLHRPPYHQCRIKSIEFKVNGCQWCVSWQFSMSSDNSGGNQLKVPLHTPHHRYMSSVLQHSLSHML